METPDGTAVLSLTCVLAGQPGPRSGPGSSPGQRTGSGQGSPQWPAARTAAAAAAQHRRPWFQAGPSGSGAVPGRPTRCHPGLGPRAAPRGPARPLGCWAARDTPQRRGWPPWLAPVTPAPPRPARPPWGPAWHLGWPCALSLAGAAGCSGPGAGHLVWEEAQTLLGGLPSPLSPLKRKQDCSRTFLHLAMQAPCLCPLSLPLPDAEYLVFCWPSRSIQSSDRRTCHQGLPAPLYPKSES